MNSLTYCIIDSKDVDYINFEEVRELAPSCLRYSLDGSKTFIKYQGEQPEFIFAITGDLVGLPEYNHAEILDILKGPEWTKQD